MKKIMKMIQSYDLNQNLSVSIFENDDRTLFYQVNEPEMSEEKRKLFQKILSILNDSLNPKLFESFENSEKRIATLQKEILRL